MAYSGTYRGTRFRSLLELAVIRSIEADGWILGRDVLYEHTRIPYGRRGRNYVVDLTMPEIRTLAEVKPSSRMNNRNNVAKRRAAEEWCRTNGWTYVVITERELERLGGSISLEVASTIPEVMLNERALRALRRKQRLRERRCRRK